MQEQFEITAEPRSDTGKGASRRLRRTGMVPGIVYGADKDPVMISLPHNELIRHLDHEAFYSHVLDLKVGGQSESVVLKDLQRHPSKPFVTHVDFQRIAADHKIKMHIPLHFVGEDVAPGVKQGGMISHAVTDVEISCLPQDLPEYIEVDVSAMEGGETLHLSDLKLPEGVVLTVLAHGEEYDTPVVALISRQAVAAEAAAREEEAEELIVEAAPEEEPEELEEREEPEEPEEGGESDAQKE
ncbi:MAG: 50S ribosomal protein L25/general stress protein Ctc [Chromatiales bacterium]|jgi:large subunit ribosomal protein L25